MGGAAHDAGAAIDEVGAVAGEDGEGGAHAVGVGVGVAGAEEDDAGILREGGRGGEEEKQGKPYKRHQDIVD